MKSEDNQSANFDEESARKEVEKIFDNELVCKVRPEEWEASIELAVSIWKDYGKQRCNDAYLDLLRNRPEFVFLDAPDV